jgi:hypothetical protein
MLLKNPTSHITRATVVLCILIRVISLDVPYKYIRILCDALCFIDCNIQGKVNEHKQEGSEKSFSTYASDNQTDSTPSRWSYSN